MTPLELRFFIEVKAGTTNARSCATWASELTGVKPRTILAYMYGERTAPVAFLEKLGVPDPAQIKVDSKVRIDHFVRAISQFCRECSGEKCWDPTCALRPVSPLPVRTKR